MDKIETIFQTNGTSFFVGQEVPSHKLKKLPPATYLLRYSMETGFYLDLHSGFELPPKIYGGLDIKAAKILNTFHDRPATTGVHLCGEKGSGKTLLTKLISEQGLKKGIPTIIVNLPASGDSFNEFLSKIEQPTIVLFDEFEKTYDEDQQKALLTLFDGVFSSKKLFLLTSNDYKQVNGLMKNRPGRIYYHMDFTGLDPRFIREYAEDNLKNKNYLQNLSVVAGFLKPLNFDMLKAIIEESNRYNESPIETLDMLNVKVNSWSDYFTITVNNPARKNAVNQKDNEIRCNPLEDFYVNEYYKTPKGKVTSVMFEVKSKDLVAADGIAGYYKYKKENGIIVELKVKPLEATGVKKYSGVLDGTNAEDHD